ncbi:MAG: T9SS type A sorting domain-containing protein [candidate division WOR-3 bacterium]
MFGITWNSGHIKGYDANQDGFNDLIFTDFQKDTTRVCFYSYHPLNIFKLKDSILKIGPQGRDDFWDINLSDGDSLVDIVTKGLELDTTIYTANITIYESRDINSYPKKKAWRWHYPINTGNWCVPVYFTDLDQDSKKEILFTGNPGTIIYIFENIANDLFVPVYCCSIVEINPYGSGFFAYADFDNDGKFEFITTCTSSQRVPNFFIWECRGDDQYLLARMDSFSLLVNSYDCITTDDLDQDGRPEVIVGSYWGTNAGTCTGCLSIFEAVGDNNFERVFVDSIPNLPYHNWAYHTHNDAGDVDGDGRDELIWAVGCNWYIYEAIGNDKYERVYQGYDPENYHNTTNIHIYDLNKNGYPEIIESGGNETHIFEISPVDLFYPENGESLIAGRLDSILWHRYMPPGADSFSIYLSFDRGMSWNLVAHSIPGTDSIYHWNLPDTTAIWCQIAILAFGPVTRWDKGDYFFSIYKSTDINEILTEEPSVKFEIIPNPSKMSFNLTITGNSSITNAKIYNISGQAIKKLKIANGHACWNGFDENGGMCPSGIYFMIVDNNNNLIKKKLVKIR